MQTRVNKQEARARADKTPLARWLFENDMSGADLVRELGERRRVFTSEATISRIKNGKPHKAAPAVIVAIKAITGLKRL